MVGQNGPTLAEEQAEQLTVSSATAEEVLEAETVVISLQAIVHPYLLKFLVWYMHFHLYTWATPLLLESIICCTANQVSWWPCCLVA
jgi:hypothetical protein